MRRIRYAIVGAVAIPALLGVAAPAANAMRPSTDSRVCHGHAQELDEDLNPTGYFWTNCNGVWMRFPE